MLGRTNELAPERFIRRTAPYGQIAAERLQGHACRRSGRGRGHGLTEGDCHGIRHTNGPLPEEPSPFEAEDAAPDAVEVDRNHRYVQAFDNSLETAFERKHVAGAADRSFRED